MAPSSFGAQDDRPAGPQTSPDPLRHFGALTPAHLVLALTAIAADGPHGERLDAVADQIPGTRDYLFTTLAGDGYNALARTLERAAAADGDLFNLLLAFLNFALERRPYFEVMARPDLYDDSDPVIVAARGLALIAFVPAARRTLGQHQVNDVVRAAWGFTERFARQWAGGAFDQVLADSGLQPSFAVAMAHGGVYSALREGIPKLPSIASLERAVDAPPGGDEPRF